MQALDRRDLLTATVRMPEKLRELMKEFPGTAVAGGFLRSVVTNEPVSDIDCFVPNEDRAALLATKLSIRKGDSWRVGKTKNAWTVYRKPYPVQFIHRWVFERPEDVIPSFDFTIARAAVWYDAVTGWTSLCDDRFYPDLAAKRLIYCSPIRNEDAGGSMLRVLKFYQRGYRIPLNSYGAVIARLVTGVEQWGRMGMTEAGLAQLLSALLVEVDPLLDPEHIAHLPSDEEGEGEDVGEI